MRVLRAREAGALGALAGILVISGAWWALALWPLPGDAPVWLIRTRAVCFGSVANGLPTTAGWMALIGQPLYMLLTLWLISGEALVGGLRALGASRGGRAVLHAATLAVTLACTAAGVRVAGGAAAANAAPAAAPPPEGAAAAWPRVDRAAPPLALVDQAGRRVTLAEFRGRPAFLTFAYAHCETVCPLIVHDLLRAQAQAAELAPAVLVVTVDPWRDTPSRLPSIATQWGLGERARVLSGPVADVERTLDRWEVGRARDLQTGEFTHPGVVYVIDRNGRVAFVVSGGGGGATTLVQLARRL